MWKFLRDHTRNFKPLLISNLEIVNFTTFHVITSSKSSKYLKGNYYQILFFVFVFQRGLITRYRAVRRAPNLRYGVIAQGTYA